MIATDDLRCVLCDGQTLERIDEHLYCKACGHKFARYKSVDFLGAYGAFDTLGLMEVTSKLSAMLDIDKARMQMRNSEAALKQRYERWTRNELEVAGNPEFGSIEQAQSVRLREWAAFEMLAESGSEFAGRKVLDNGAGLGSDAIRLVNRGAEVTCIDFNPTSVHLGGKIVPEARWIAATSEALPFKTASFDISVANAALHHMHDFEAAFEEMLRVTRPGGWILLISDPFIEESTDPEYRERTEVSIFARHPMVLGGVNEGMLPIDKYLGCIQRCEDVQLLTMRIHNVEDGDKPRFWKPDAETLVELSKRRGNISSRGRVPKLDIVPPIVNETLPADKLFETIGSPAASWAFLIDYLDKTHFDRFPFDEFTKFELMNGWLPNMQGPLPWRNGYGRVRLFLTGQRLEKIRGLQVKPFEATAASKFGVRVTVNGAQAGEFDVVGATPQTILTDSFRDRLGERNVIEFAVKDDIEDKGAVWSTFDKSRMLSVRLFAHPAPS